MLLPAILSAALASGQAATPCWEAGAGASLGYGTFDNRGLPSAGLHLDVRRHLEEPLFAFLQVRHLRLSRSSEEESGAFRREKTEEVACLGALLGMGVRWEPGDYRLRIGAGLGAESFDAERGGKTVDSGLATSQVAEAGGTGLLASLQIDALIGLGGSLDLRLSLSGDLSLRGGYGARRRMDEGFAVGLGIVAGF